MCQASTCGRVLAWALVQVLQNNASRMVMLRFTILLARDRHWRNPRKKKIIESAAVWKARVSVPRKMAKAQQSVSAHYGNRSQVAKLTATHLNDSAIGSYRLLEKNNIWLVVFRHLQPIVLRTGLSFLDSSDWISSLNTKYEISWTQTFDQYIYSIWDRLELK